MQLYNCVSKEELELKEINLDLLSKKEKRDLADKIEIMYSAGTLKDERIVIDALMQILHNL
jgi:hypothetical protein